MNVPQTVPSVTGPATACAGTSGYIYLTESGMTGYVWTVSSGGTIQSGAGTNAITVSWNTAGQESVSVIYTGAPSAGSLSVDVQAPQPVTVLISPSANPVCAGTSVNFTATAGNAGTAPVYQWKVNGIAIGSNSSVFSYIPSNGDIVGCQVTSSLSCVSGNPAVAVPVTMVVNSAPQAGVTVTASANPVCQGTGVTMTAIPVNGGTTPVFQWKLNGLPVGSGGPVYSFTPTGGDAVQCVLNSSLQCVTGNPATSNTVTMAVGASQPVSVSITASANPSCQGIPVVFTAQPVNGGTQPVYQWSVNGAVQGSNSPTLTYIPASGDLVICELTSGVSCATGNPATSNVIAMTVNQSLPAGVSISPSANPVCQGNTVTFSATPANGGTVPSFQWTVNGFTVGTNAATFTYSPAGGDIIRCQMQSSLSCATGNPALSNQVVMSVNPVLPVNVTVSASSNPVCNGNPVTFTATPYNAGASPSFQWQVNSVNSGTGGSTFTYVPAQGDQVSCLLTSSASCTQGTVVGSNVVTMTVSTNQSVSVTIAAPVTTLCQGMSADFTATPVNGGSSPSYQWKVNGATAGSNSPNFSYFPSDGDVVTCQLTSSAICTLVNPVQSNVVTLSVIQGQTLPVGITISPSVSPSCTGQTVTFTALPSNGGLTPAYQWFVNGINVGANSPTYAYIPANGDFVRCQLTSSYICATGNPAMSNQIACTVNPYVTPSITISASSNPSCLGSAVTYTANAVNPGSSPVYHWKVNGVSSGTNQPTFVYTPANAEVITCQLISSLPCTTANPVNSNAITMNVQPVSAVSVSIATATNPCCQYTQATIRAYPVNGGSSPQYQWKLNGNNVGNNSVTFIYTPATGDVLSCTMISNALCYLGSKTVTSNQITMAVAAELAPAITIASSSNPFCEGTPVTLTATPINGGNTPVYQWKVNCVNVGTNNPVYTYTPLNGDFVTCSMNSSLTCATFNPAVSNAVSLRLNTDTPAGVSITPSANPVCPSTPVTFTASPQNGGTSPVYQWKVNGVVSGSTGGSFAYTPANGDAVTCRMTSNAACVSGSPVTSAPVVISVNGSLPASVSIIAGANPFCTGSPVTFTATPVNGGTAPLFQWQINGVNAGAPSVSTQKVLNPSNGDIVTCQMTSNATCVAGGNPVTSNAVSMVAQASITPSVTVSSPVTTVCQGTQVTYSALAVNPGESPVYQWKVNGAAVGINSPQFTYAPSNGNLVSCELTASHSCASINPAVSNTVSMTVNPSMPVSVSVVPSVNPCCAGTPVTFTATPVNGGVTPSYQWKVNCVNVGTNSNTYTYVPQNGDVIVCVLTSSEPCATGNPAISGNVNMTVYPMLPASVLITTPVNPFCVGSFVVFTAEAQNAGFSPVFQWKVNGVNMGTNSSTFTYSPSDGDVVTCVMTSSLTCVSTNPAISNSIVMIGNTGMPVTIAITSDWTSTNNTICQGTMVYYTATIANGGSQPGYQWKVNGVNKGANLPQYEYYPVNGDVVTCVLTSSLTCASNNPATSNAIAMSVNPIMPLSVNVTPSANPSCIGNSVTFSAAVTNGGPTPTYRWRVNGVYNAVTTPTYTYVPANGDAVACRVISSEMCPSGSPAVSNVVTMTVSPIATASVTITPSANPVCQGASVTFTATPFNGGNTPVYQWKVNGSNVGTNSNAFSYIPVNGDVVTCQMISNSPCTPVTQVVSNPLLMTVSPVQPVSVSASASTNPTCINSPVVFTAIGTNGGSSPVYQWRVNGLTVGANNPVYTFIPQNGDIVKCTLTSNAACATGNPATSPNITMTVSESLPVSVSINSLQGVVCQGSPVSFSATSVNGGASPAYQWRVNGIDVGTNSPAFSYVPSNGDFVNCQLTSSFSCGTGNPAQSNTIAVSVNPVVPPSVSITSSANPVCEGTVVIYTASPVNGGNNPVFSWKVNGMTAGTNSPTFIHTPLNGDVVSCIMISSEACPVTNPVQSTPITMQVFQPVAAGISIVPSLNPVCPGMPVQFTANLTNGGISPVLNWFVNSVLVAAGTSTFSYVPNDQDTVKCQLISNSNCVTVSTVVSDPVILSVSTNLAVSVAVAASANPSCQGQEVTYTAIGTNGGNAPLYQWMVNGIQVGPNAPQFQFTPAAGDVITCQLTSDLSCATGNPAVSPPLVMTVEQSIPAGVSITVAANPVCLGSPASFTAWPVNGGITPDYQWKVNGVNAGGNSAAFSYVPANGDIVTCVMTSNYSCSFGSVVTSNSVVLAVSSDLPVSISVSASANPVCTGIPVTFSATSSNGGDLPVYQWKVNGVAAGTNQPSFTYLPSDGDQVLCHLTSNLTCATGNPAVSLPVLMSVYSGQPASVSISSSPAGAVCQGGDVTFTATPVNGGSPSYQWLRNGIPVGSNQPVYTLQPVNGDQVRVIMTSGLACVSGSPAASNVVTVTVDPVLPASVVITADQTSVCQGQAVTVTAIPSNGGTAMYQWYRNNIPVGANQPTYGFVPADGDQVRVVMTSSLPCATANPAQSNTVAFSVSQAVPVSITISASQNNICTGTPVTFTATSVNGGSAPVYQWFVNNLPAGGNQSSMTYVPQNNDLVHATLTSSLTCVSGSPAVSGTIAMTVNPVLPASVSISASQTTVCSGTSVVFTATPVNGGVPSYQWYRNGLPVGLNQPTYSYIPSNGDLVHVVMTSGLTCAGGNPATSNVVSMNVTPQIPVSLSISANQTTVCQGNQVTVTAAPQNGGVPTYQWYLNNVPSGINQPTYTFIPANGDQVYAVMTSSLTCTTGSPATSGTLTFTVNPILNASVAVSASQNNVCAGTTVTFTATPTNGGTPAYQWYRNGLPAGTGQATYSYIPANGDQVYVVMTSTATCVSGSPATSNTVVMTVNALVPSSVSIAASQNNICEGTPVTFTATPVNGGTPVYQWYVNSLPAGTNLPTYTYTPGNGDQVYVVMTSNALCASGSPATSNTILMTVNPVATVSVSISPNQNNVCQGSVVTFTATPQNGGSPVYEWYRNNVAQGVNLPVYSCIPDNGDQIYAVMTSTLSCTAGSPAVSNTVVMQVNPLLPVSVTVTASQNDICEGTEVTYTAFPVNGGNPVFQWYRNGIAVGMNQPTFTLIPMNGDRIHAVMTSGLACVTGSPAVSDTVTMIVNPLLPVSVTISPDQNNVCDGTPVTLSAVPVNGGNPNYQWYLNGQPAGANQADFTYVPSNGDQVWVSIHSSLECISGDPATSNIVSLTVREKLPVSVMAVPGQNPSCLGSPVVFTAIPVNGGSASYQWYRNDQPAGSNDPVFTVVPDQGDRVYVVMTSGLDCISGSPATSNVIEMAVNGYVQASVTAAADQTQVCQGTTATFTANPVNGGGAGYQWRVNGNPMGLNQPEFSYMPSDGDVVDVVMTSGLTCVTGSPATSNAIRMTVMTLPATAGMISGPSELCEGTGTVTYSVSPVPGASEYNWTLPSGMSFVSGNHTPSVTVDPGSTPLQGSITVSASNACGNGGVSPALAVSVNAVPETPAITLKWPVLTSSADTGNRWYFEGSLIEGAEASSYKTTKKGWYWSSVVQNGCESDTSNHVYVDDYDPAGLEPGILVYPVPNDGSFTIEITMPDPVVYDITMYDEIGRKVYEIKDFHVNIHRKELVNMQPVRRGVYSVVFRSGTEQTVRKIIVNYP